MTQIETSKTLQEQKPSANRWLILLKVAVALLLLNFLTTFTNIWSTPYVQPDTRVGADFILIWLALLGLIWFAGSISRRAIKWLTVFAFIAVIGRYVDVTVPAWFGRKVNLYWDAQHLPTFLDVASQNYSWWQLLGMVVALLAGLWLLFRILRLCIEILAEHAAPYARKSVAVWIVTAGLTGVIIAGLFKFEPVERYVAQPVYPVYQRQAHLLSAAFFPEFFLSSLPATPPMDSDLKALNGAEVKVIFLESYGAATYERDDLFDVIHPSRLALEKAAKEQGRVIVSGFIKAAAFGGASDLSHLSFLTGIDLTDPLRHDLLITTERPTINETFEKAGYRTIGWYPAMSWDWPEVSFYSFDHYHDAPSMDYKGPKLGLWWLPDQYSMARADEMYPPDPEGKPRFLFFPTITTHIPFRPTPPYQPDWSLVTTDQPYTEEATAKSIADAIDWHGLFQGFINTMNYTFEWLAGYQALPQQRDSILILLGDHQPGGGITGPDATWNVPVHIITSNTLIAERLRKRGFQDGMNPEQVSLGHVSEFSQMLLSVFDSDEVVEDSFNKPAVQASR